ncbi:MAG: hypothetical protein ACXWZB_01255 [Gaiellaceae bacterium]
MKKRTKLAAGAGAALAVVGAGAAVGATKLAPSTESKAIVDDVAKQLGVEPAKVSAALERALENRIDAAVESGRLTEKQGEAMKQKLRSSDLPLFAGPMLGKHRGGHQAFGHLEAAAAYLGVSEASLRETLRDGKTLAQAAKDAGKPVDGLVDALVAETTKKLDRAVEDGDLTRAQRDRIVAGLEQRTSDFVNGNRPAVREKRGFGFGGGPHGLGPGPRFHEDVPAPDA